MSITKSIVDLMHGTIEVESGLNRGTAITVEIPLTLAKEAPRKSSLMAKQHSVFAGRRVLVAEDIAVNAEVVCLMIGMVTHNMQQAARVSDRTAFFLMGELVECGDTHQIFSEPAHQKTADYVSGRFG